MPGNRRSIALAFLRAHLGGVGHRRREWFQKGKHQVYHLRRLTTPDEQARIGPVRDLRGPDPEKVRERMERVRAMSAVLGLSMEQLKDMEKDLWRDQ